MPIAQTIMQFMQMRRQAIAEERNYEKQLGDLAVKSPEAANILWERWKDEPGPFKAEPSVIGGKKEQKAVTAHPALGDIATQEVVKGGIPVSPEKAELWRLGKAGGKSTEELINLMLGIKSKPWEEKLGATIEIIKNVKDPNAKNILLKSLGALPSPESIDDILAEKVRTGGLTLKEAYAMKKTPSVSIQFGTKPAPSQERTKITQLMSFRGSLNKITDLFNKSYVGPAEARVGAIRDLTGLMLGRGKEAANKEVIFRQVIQQLGDDLLRLRSGAQINEQEYQRMRKFLPKLTDPDRIFLGKLKAVFDYINNLIEIKQNALKESGFLVPTGKTTIRLENMTDEELFNVK